MDLKPLSEVDLREAIGPINRAVTGHYLPAVRTVSWLRERANLGVLDLKLSRCAFLGRELVGTCLFERVEQFAHVDAIGVDPLAQQRGVGHALLEAACAAAEAAGVRLVTAEASDADTAALATLQSAGFAARQALSRWELQGEPRALPLPDEIGPETTGRPQGPGQLLASPCALDEALTYLAAPERAPAGPVPFCLQPEVLRRLQGKLGAMLLLHMDTAEPVRAAVIFESAQRSGAPFFDSAQRSGAPFFDSAQRSGAPSSEKDRQRLVRAAGEAGPLSVLVGLLLRRHGVTHVPEVPADEQVAAALVEAGLVRVALRTELARALP